jgi:hypothetical protein
MAAAQMAKHRAGSPVHNQLKSNDLKEISGLGHFQLVFENYSH